MISGGSRMRRPHTPRPSADIFRRPTAVASHPARPESASLQERERDSAALMPAAATAAAMTATIRRRRCRVAARRAVMAGDDAARCYYRLRHQADRHYHAGHFELPSAAISAAAQAQCPAGWPCSSAFTSRPRPPIKTKRGHTPTFIMATASRAFTQNRPAIPEQAARVSRHGPEGIRRALPPRPRISSANTTSRTTYSWPSMLL